MKPRLHILGCGRAASTLSRLWAEAGQFEIGQILNQSQTSGQSAADFIGQGRAVMQFERIRSGDWLMLGVPESALSAKAIELKRAWPMSFRYAFHLSGAESSRLLNGLAEAVASVHPACPFSQPADVMDYLHGTFAVGEGDKSALDAILPMFSALGMRTLRLDADDFSPCKKRIYHAATIAASNFLNTLDALALALTNQAGLPDEAARQLIVSLQKAGLSQIEKIGPGAALTGPIERMDSAALQSMVESIRAAAPDRMALFDALTDATVDLAIQKYPAQKSEYDRMRQTLRAGGSDGGF